MPKEQISKQMFQQNQIPQSRLVLILPVVSVENACALEGSVDGGYKGSVRQCLGESAKVIFAKF